MLMNAVGDQGYAIQRGIPALPRRAAAQLLFETGQGCGKAMQDLPAIAAGSLSIAFGDFNAGYQIVDRQGIRILRDSFTAKPYVKFYTTKRVGGDVVNFEAIKLLKFAAS